MPKDTPFVSVVIPLLNEEQYVGDCLSALLSLNYPTDRYEIIVVDNGSTDRSCEVVERFGVRLLRRPHVKVGAVRNYGVSHARGDVLAFIDSDCVAYSDWLRDGVDKLSGSDAVGGLVMLREGPVWVERNWILRSSRSYLYQNHLSGACIFIKREVFEKVGGFDSQLNSGEDTALTHTLRQRGYSVAMDPKLNVVHLGYPRTLRAFISRQKWHSADYAFNLRNVFGDRTMLLVVLFTLCWGVLLISIIAADPVLVGLASLLILGIPLLFSIKRISRYRGWSEGRDCFSVYVVDVLYVVGRALGLLEGLVRRVRRQSNIKVRR